MGYRSLFYLKNRVQKLEVSFQDTNLLLKLFIYLEFDFRRIFREIISHFSRVGILGSPERNQSEEIPARDGSR